jgi:hypothetical protein
MDFGDCPHCGEASGVRMNFDTLGEVHECLSCHKPVLVEYDEHGDEDGDEHGWFWLTAP